MKKPPNAIAERINGILKDEYLMEYSVKNISQAKQLLDSVIERYNQERPHMSISNLTPEYVHISQIKTKRLWKNYYRQSEDSVNLKQDEETNVNLYQD